jgi:hypothetical protein
MVHGAVCIGEALDVDVVHDILPRELLEHGPFSVNILTCIALDIPPTVPSIFQVPSLYIFVFTHKKPHVISVRESEASQTSASRNRGRSS